MIKNLLKEFRAAKSQAEMVREYKVSQQGGQSLEIERTVPDNVTMLQMEKNFNVPMEIIFF